MTADLDALRERHKNCTSDFCAQWTKSRMPEQDDARVALDDADEWRKAYLESRAERDAARAALDAHLADQRVRIPDNEVLRAERDAARADAAALAAWIEDNVEKPCPPLAAHRALEGD